MASSFVSMAAILALGSGSAFAVWTQDQATASDQQSFTINTSIDNRLTYSIPTQSMRQALLIYGEHTGVQVSTDPAAIAGLKSPAIEGKFTPLQALKKILSGTNLTFQYIGGTSVVVTPPNPVYAQADNNIQLGSSVLLNPIDVEDGADEDASSGAGFQGTPDWVYETPDSVSVISREAILNNPTRNTADLFQGVPGVIASQDEGQNPGLSINIRGLQNQTRINTMIDGARQNFQRNAHGSTGRVYVDPSMIREVDIEKSGSSGVGGAATLGGSVNFRTIRAGDLISSGELFGGEINFAKGDNGYLYSGSASMAARLSDDVSIVAAFSHKKLDEYEIGQNGEVRIQGVEDQSLFMGQDTWSGLLKLEANLSEFMKLEVSWLGYMSEFAQGPDSDGTGGRKDVEDITNHTFTGAFSWNPQSDMVDLKARVWLNKTDNKESRGPRPVTGAFDVDYSMTGTGASVENTSRFELPFAKMALNYGVEAFRDDGKTKAGGDWIATEPDAVWWYQGTNPSGRRDVGSGFASATFDYGDWLTVSAGLRYDHYQITGSTTIFGAKTTTKIITTELVWKSGGCIPGGIGRVNWSIFQRRGEIPMNEPWPGEDGEYCAPGEWVEEETSTFVDDYHPETVDVDISGGAVMPTATVMVTPFKGLQLFTKYSESYRPPTILEAVLGGSHIGAYTLQQAPNPDLHAETAQTWEIGANLTFDNIISSGDKFRMKAVAFDRKVNDFIVVGALEMTPSQSTTPVAYSVNLNMEEETPMRGVEVEANYDAGSFYVGGSFSTLDMGLGSTFTHNGITQDIGNFIVFIPPKYQFALDAGIRLFDQKLTLGARMVQLGVADEHVGAGGVDGPIGSALVTEDYTVFDLYGSYALTEKTKLSFLVDNLTDVAYVNALGAPRYPAPGRTITATLNMKF